MVKIKRREGNEDDDDDDGMPIDERKKKSWMRIRSTCELRVPLLREDVVRHVTPSESGYVTCAGFLFLVPQEEESILFLVEFSECMPLSRSLYDTAEVGTVSESPV